MGYEFTNNTEPFAVDVLVESLFAFAFELTNALIDTREKRLIYIVVLGVLGMFMEFTTYFFDYKKPYTKFSEILKSSMAEALANRSKEHSKLVDSNMSASND